MEKKISDEELDRLLEEQYLKEADLIEKELFSDDFEGFEDETQEEVDEAYARLVERLKASGDYREESVDSEEIEVHEPEICSDKVISMDARKAETECKSKKQAKYKPEPGMGQKSCRRHRMVKAAGFVVVCALGVLAAGMTSEANRKYAIEKVRYLVGDDTRIVVDNDAINESANMDEDEARKEIKEKLGIEIPEFFYVPEGLEFYNYRIELMNNTANLKYKYGDTMLVLYGIKKDNERSSVNFSLHGSEVGTIELQYESIHADIIEIKEKKDIVPNYVAQWEREDIVYQLCGKLKKEEFIKIVKKIKYLS